ncbi:MAG: hypothetical protein WB626_06005 [Bacteroidota bacterium]
MKIPAGILAVLLIRGGILWGAAPPDTGTGMLGVSAGMGVSAVHAHDLTELVRASTGSADDFKSCVEFFGGVTVPLAPRWVVKLHYAYLLGSWNGAATFGPVEYSFEAHLPALVLQRILVDEGVYDLRAGAGMGYHLGRLTDRRPGSEARYTGRGWGLLAEIEAGTAFGDRLFGSVGGDLRWDFIGDLKNEAGRGPIGTGGGSVTGRFFSAGVKLGFRYDI